MMSTESVAATSPPPRFNCPCGDRKILFYCRFPPPYTGETVMSERLFRSVKGCLPATAFEALGHRRDPLIGGRLRPRTAWQYAWRFAQLMRHLKRDPQHCLYFAPSSSRLGHLRDTAMVRGIRPHVCRIVAHVHSGNFHEVLRGQRNKRSFIQNVDAFIFLADSLARRTDGLILAEKRFVVPNTIVDEMQFSEEQVEQKIADRRSRDQFNILFLSNMHPEKGYRDLAEALCRIDLPCRWHAHFVGGWPTDSAREDLLALLKQHEIASNVTVHGKIEDRQRIKMLHRDADVFVLPTYYPVEAQPVSMIEAWNAATPVVATRHASIPDYLRDGENGYLVDKQSPRQIAAALTRLADPIGWEEKARSGRRTYLQSFHDDVVSQAFREILAC